MKKIKLFFYLFLGVIASTIAQSSPIKLEFKYVGENITSAHELNNKNGFVQLADNSVVIFNEKDKSFHTFSVINHEKMYNNGRPFLAIGANDINLNKILIFVFYGKDGNINMVSFKDEKGNAIIYTDKKYI